MIQQHCQSQILEPEEQSTHSQDNLILHSVYTNKVCFNLEARNLLEIDKNTDNLHGSNSKTTELQSGLETNGSQLATD